MGNCEALLQSIVDELKKLNTNMETVKENQTKTNEHLKSLDDTIKGVLNG